MEGYDIFKVKGQCASCHILDPDPQAGKILFTDYSYDNRGIPKNPHSTYYHQPQFNPDTTNWIDLGLGVTVKNTEENGKFRVPTLRNIELTAPYGHNSYFTTLEDIIHFYNVRDISEEYPPAEYPQTINSEELGNLQMTLKEEQALVAFLKTLTDGYKVN
ncbi:MAG: c-type cytochrome [Rikenellaceae bacterium]